MAQTTKPGAPGIIYLRRDGENGNYFFPEWIQDGSADPDQDLEYRLEPTTQEQIQAEIKRLEAKAHALAETEGAPDTRKRPAQVCDELEAAILTSLKVAGQKTTYFHIINITLAHFDQSSSYRLLSHADMMAKMPPRQLTKLEQLSISDLQLLIREASTMMREGAEPDTWRSLRDKALTMYKVKIQQIKREAGL